MENASEYFITILNEAGIVARSVSSTEPLVNLVEISPSLESGTYTIKVIAAGDETSYENSNESEASPEVTIS